MIGRLWARVDVRWALRWIGLPIAAGALVAALVDPWSPAVFGREKISAVLLLDGQAYFGHLADDPSRDTIELRDVYYFQDARSTTTNVAVGLVKRGSEVHQPADGMSLRRDKVLAIERVGSDSPVAAAIAADRTIQAGAPR